MACVPKQRYFGYPGRALVKGPDLCTKLVPSRYSEQLQGAMDFLYFDVQTQVRGSGLASVPFGAPNSPKSVLFLHVSAKVGSIYRFGALGFMNREVDNN